MRRDLSNAIATALDRSARAVQPLHGGCVGEVYRITLDDDTRIVAKVDDQGRLCCEGDMLRYLAAHSTLPVPAVLHSSPQLLLMEFVEGESHFNRAAERHAAELLAALHGIHAPAFGFETSTLIGGLHQPNPWNTSWLEFFREQRLLHMGGEALRGGRMPQRLYARLEKFAGRLDKWLSEPERPSLIHGDVWTTNVLAHNGRITGFIDPAVYYAHPEIELAFTTLFGTFGSAFFERYRELRPLKPGFFEERRDIYNLYPLLVHVRLFGGGYAASVDQTLNRFGY
ncbi:MAG: fructosamine kinase family protein [Gammaproteobacteria bacterium]